MHEMWFYDRSIKWRLVGVRIVLVIDMFVCVRARATEYVK